MDGFEYQLMDLKGLLLVKYKSFQLTEDECMILLMLLLYEHAKVDTRKMIQQQTNYESNRIDTILMQLIRKNLIAMNGVEFNLDLLKQKLVSSDTKENNEIDLLSRFENEFGRTLNPTEIEALCTWKNSGYEDSMIIDAMKEASLRNIQSFKYIEAILRDWTKNGVRRSGKEKVAPKDTVQYNDYKWWEEE